MLVGYGFDASEAGAGRTAHSAATDAKVTNVIVLTIFRFIDFPLFYGFQFTAARSFSLRHFYIAGAAVPSDHLPTGITNSVMGSGPSRNAGFRVTGELGRSAPQEALSVSGK